MLRMQGSAKSYDRYIVRIKLSNKDICLPYLNTKI